MSRLFEEASRYDSWLERGLRATGEGRSFFVTGRLEALRRRLPEGLPVRRILDFGCGTGAASAELAERFSARVVGVDTAGGALDHARERFGSNQVRFAAPAALAREEPFDLCYLNGVLHHVEPEARPELLGRVRAALGPAGLLALFENNPWNPGTRWVMSRIPFDREARVLSARRARRLLERAGFEPLGPARFLFVFPRVLAGLRWLEPHLERLPLGGQYLILAQPRFVEATP